MKSAAPAAVVRPLSYFAAGAATGVASGPRVRIRYTVASTQRPPRRWYEADPAADRALRARRLSLLPEPVHAARDQDADRRGAAALRPVPARKRPGEDGRRGAHELRRPSLWLSVCEAGAPSAHGPARDAAVR